MDIKTALINEIKYEAANTRKMLERVPADQFGWKPHDKSRALMNITKHVATIYNWVPRIANSSEFDVAKGVTPAPDFTTNQELLTLHDKTVNEAVQHLETMSSDALAQPWTFRSGDHVIFTLPKAAVIRNMALNHLVHHRGQLSVYLRLMNVPVPGMYGPSADE
jgi:uncharacterized damage-inducible protein DinB